MVHPPSLRPARRTGAIAVVLAVVLGVLAAFAAPVAAASQLTLVDSADGGYVVGSTPSGPIINWAGTFAVEVNGEATVAYCVDIHTPISPGDVLDESDWTSSGVADLESVARILNAYFPNGSGPAGYELVGNTNQQAASVQAAIWSYTDDFELSTSVNLPSVQQNYATIRAAVADGALPSLGEPVSSLSLAPGTQSGTAGDVVGPFEVQTSAAEVSLTATDADLVSWPDGAPFVGPAVDGTEVGLVRTEAGAATLDAEASAEVTSGRIFHAPERQRLILATTVTSIVTATATANWDATQEPEDPQDPQDPVDDQSDDETSDDPGDDDTTTDHTTDEVTTGDDETTDEVTTVDDRDRATVASSGGDVEAGADRGTLPATGAAPAGLAALGALLLAAGAGLTSLRPRHEAR